MTTGPQQETRTTTSDAAPAPVGAAPRRRSRPGPMLTMGLPLGISLLLHALLLAATAVVVWQVASATPPPRPPVSITFSDPGQGTEAPLPPEPDEAPEEEPAVVVPTASSAPAAPGGTDPGPPPALRGESTGLGSASAPSLRGVSVPRQAALLTEAPRSSEVRFAGMGASDATSVVFVVDGSGPMVSSLTIVLDEVKRSVSRLGPSQKFSVVVFRRVRDGEAGYEWFTPALIRATPDAVSRLVEWLGTIKAGGRSNPLDGLRAALSMEPDAVFLLSHSIERTGGGVWHLGLERTLAELDRLNPVHPATGTRPVVIKTIQFLNEDPTGVMQEIGRLHGGVTAANPRPADAYTVIKRAAELRTRGEADDRGEPIIGE